MPTYPMAPGVWRIDSIMDPVAGILSAEGAKLCRNNTFCKKKSYVPELDSRVYTMIF